MSPWPWVTRCTIEGDTGGVPGSVIVKVRRPEVHRRSEPERLHHEQAALEFLTSIGSAAGPRLLTADNEAGILVMEDLGIGPALEDLLVGSDTSRAEQGLIAFATALGRMHATTAGHAVQYYQLRSRYGPVDPAFDRISILGIDIEGAFRQLREITASRPYLPPAVNVEKDVDELLRVLSEPGPYLAFSNGDTCPANCRMSDDGLQFIDFEHASFRHALLDVTALRFPFPACPCWSRLPEEVGRRAEDAYRKEMARSYPDVLDHASYAHGLTAACAAWTIMRMVRLPKLEKTDEPHPMGFSRRGQLLDTITTTVNCSQQSHSLQPLACWLASVSGALRARWPHLPSTQPFYPAFR
jgi:tRNA A-37 threonylcarbamoyl transferase component Bud32